MGFLKLLHMKTQLELTNLVIKPLPAEISGLHSASWIQYISTSLPTRCRVLSIDRLTQSLAELFIPIFIQLHLAWVLGFGCDSADELSSTYLLSLEEITHLDHYIRFL